MGPAKLDYLFVADFQDGSRYFQTREDSSIFHPLTKSAFWDVAQRVGDVKQFTLTDGRHEHTVFLDDGHFKSDGEIIIPPRASLRDFQLLYFRRVEQTIQPEGTTPAKIIGYFLGWDAIDEAGQFFRMLLQIPPSGSLEKPMVKL